jgi:hypothetical protein
MENSPCKYRCYNMPLMISWENLKGGFIHCHCHMITAIQEFLKMMTHKILNRDPKDEILKARRS